MLSNLINARAEASEQATEAEQVLERFMGSVHQKMERCQRPDWALRELDLRNALRLRARQAEAAVARFQLR